MTEAQHGIFTEGAPHHLYLEMTVAPDASPANLRRALGMFLGAPGLAGPEIVIAFGSETWSSLSGTSLPSGLRPFDALTSQLEPLRAELDRAHEREKQLTEMTQNHPFLPVHNRREFLRELTHVLNHMEHLSTPPALILVHASNADAVRLRAGRNTLDAFLERFASTLDGMLHPTDVIGSLGGNDFGIVVLTGSREAAESVIEAMTVALDGNSLSSPHGTFPLVAKFGYAILEEGMTAERAVADADADLRRRR